MFTDTKTSILSLLLITASLLFIESAAWKDCANDYFCAQDIMKGYLQKFSKDCNSDGMINCYDILTINSNGGDCRPLNQSSSGRVWLKRYEECRVARILT
ncbi:i-type lysozyme [Danaus plexippus plexippus]|uniref:lysozyme n=1 Tax=Danaus plexippus plexippus TaxID=278856 RepID=A0A212FKY9_DANPL|nr:i-type lysozyme [Danaus plexippus plexippus]